MRLNLVCYLCRTNPSHTLGLLAKIIPLFDDRSTRIVALQALSTVTHHGGAEVRREIALHTTSTLIRLMEEFPEDMIINELVMVTLAQ